MTPKTRRKTEFYRLLSYRQSFVKSIGVFPGPRSTSLKKHAVLRELIYSGGSCSEISLEMKFLFSKKVVRDTLKMVPIKIHASKFQFLNISCLTKSQNFQKPQIRVDWVCYITFSVYQAFHVSPNV